MERSAHFAQNHHPKSKLNCKPKIAAHSQSQIEKEEEGEEEKEKRIKRRKKKEKEKKKDKVQRKKRVGGLLLKGGWDHVVRYEIKKKN